MAVRIVVPLLAAAEFVATDQQRAALRKEERRQEIAQLPAAQLVDRLVVGWPLHSAVPRAIVVVAVLVVLLVRLVVFLVVRDAIVEREAVVRGDEVDARVRPAAVVF